MPEARRSQPSPEPRADTPSQRDAPEGGTTAPPARRLRGDADPNPDPLAVVRLLLTCARRAGFAFEPAWELASEAALSYMSDDEAEHWWAALTATERAWADAYAKRHSPAGTGSKRSTSGLIEETCSGV